MVHKMRRLAGCLAVSLFCAVVSQNCVYGAVGAPTVSVLTPPITAGVASPLRIAFDSKGNFIVADPRIGGMARFNGQGQLQEIIKSDRPLFAVAIAANGSLIASKGDSVVFLDNSGNETGKLGTGAGQFKKASAMVADAAGFIYVTDSLDNNVKVFTAAGSFVKAIGTKGANAGQFVSPAGIAYDKVANLIAVADTGNGRVQFFNAGGNYDYVKTIGMLGVGPMKFRTPVGIAFESIASGAGTRMYVVDTYQNNMQIIDPSGAGSYLSVVAATGFASGDMMLPVDVAFDQLGSRLLVANASGQITQLGIDGGIAMVPNAQDALMVDPLPGSVATTTVTITGTVANGLNVILNTRYSLSPLPVVYTSANTWKCVVTGLALGANTINVKAFNANGTVARHAVSVSYRP